MDRTATQHDQAVHGVARLLLSHHPPEHGHRTLPVPGTGGVRVCARCSGIVGGVLVASIAGWLAGGFSPARPGLWWLVPLMILPAIVDFHGQLMRRWESTNPRRLVTGGLFGAALGLALWAACRGSWQAPCALLAGLFGYFGWVALGRRRVVRLVQHVRLYVDYYERCCAEDARRAVDGV